MNKRTENQLNMYRTVNKVLSSYQVILDASPALHDAVSDLKSKTSLLGQLAKQQGNSTLGVKAIKKQERLAAADQAEALADALRIHAFQARDVGLKEQMRFNKSLMMNCSTLRLTQIFERIRENAVNHAAAITAYGITPLQINEFEATCDHITEILGSTRTAIVKRSQQTIAIRDLTREISELLKGNIDKQLRLLRKTYPALVDQYLKARITVDHRGKTNPKKNLGTLPPSVPVT